MFSAIYFRVLIISLLYNLVCPYPFFAQTLTSSNLPVIVIDTQNGQGISDEPKIQAQMGVINNGNGVRNNITDPFNDFYGRIGIERRGSSSQMFGKTQYGLEIWTSSNADSSASLLGLPGEEDWILFAPFNDKSLMRDVLAYKMGRDLGRYASRTKYCELILNGSYEGIYVLMEKIKRDKNRLDISKLDVDENSGDDLSGGYILKIDKFSGEIGGGFASMYPPEDRHSNQQIFFQYDYPEPEDITSNQQSYISHYVRNFEDVLKSREYNHPDQGYSAFIDVDSFVDFMIMNEVSKNVDGYRLSTYLHKDKNSVDGKLKMGPIWDFNLGFGNADYCTSGQPQGFVYKFNSICADDPWLIPFWWRRLLQDNNFRTALVARWQELRTGKFRTEAIHAYIDSVASVLNGESQQRNFQRWPVLGAWVWPNFYVGASYDDELGFLKYWVEARMNWLDDQWQEGYTTSAETGHDSDITISPNPSRGTWTVVMKDGDATIELLDSQGRTLRGNHWAGEKEIIIDGTGYPDGIYLIKITGRNGTEVRKALKTSR